MPYTHVWARPNRHNFADIRAVIARPLHAIQSAREQGCIWGKEGCWPTPNNTPKVFRGWLASCTLCKNLVQNHHFTLSWCDCQVPKCTKFKISRGPGQAYNAPPDSLVDGERESPLKNPSPLSALRSWSAGPSATLHSADLPCWNFANTAIRGSRPITWWWVTLFSSKGYFLVCRKVMQHTTGITASWLPCVPMAGSASAAMLVQNILGPLDFRPTFKL